MQDILFITIDSLRADHVGYHGYERETTPNIDAYAESGSAFMNTFAHVGGTRMSFPSILTSVYPQMYGGYERVSEEQTVVAEVFQNAGYETAGFHSNLYLSAEFGYDRGFDRFFDSKPDPSMLSRVRQYVKKNMQESAVFPFLKRAYDFVESSSGINVGSYHVPADEITDMAIQHIKQSDPSSPNFLWVHYMDVHHPFLPPTEYQFEFREEPIGDREAIKLRRKLLEEPESITEKELDDVKDLYDSEIRFNDAEVGRLVDQARKVWGDDAITVITSDHGEHFLEHGFFSGAQLYDVKLHVPLVVNGWEDHGTYEELIGLIDIPTTLIQIAQLDKPTNFYGESLTNLVDEGVWERREILGGLGLDSPDFMCRTDEWKYIKRQSQTENELYNLSEDPEEQNNVANHHMEVVERLEKRLDEHRQAISETQTAIESVSMDEHTKERLRMLGYKE